MDSDKNNRAENSNCAEDSGGGDRVDSSDNGSMSDCPQSGASMCSISGSDMELYELESVEYILNYNWLGVTCFGENVEGEFELFYQYIHKNKRIFIPDGYVSNWCVKYHKDGGIGNKLVNCKVTAQHSIPIYTCTVEMVKFSSSVISTAVVKALKHANTVGVKKWSGYNFFGFHNNIVVKKLEVCSVKEKGKIVKEKTLSNIQKILQRKGGPTSEMKSKQAMQQRNDKINAVVELSSFGDIKSYISYLINKFPELVDDCIDLDMKYKKHKTKHIINNPPCVILDIKQSAELLLGWTSLTQREYNSVKEILSIQKVQIAPHSKVREYIKTLDVGELNQHFCGCDRECMSCSAKSVVETLTILIKSSHWFSKMIFMNISVSHRLFVFLKEYSPDLYGNLDPMKRTLFLRVTGDNFRAACKFPTEQMSFSVRRRIITFTIWTIYIFSMERF